MRCNMRRDHQYAVGQSAYIMGHPIFSAAGKEDRKHTRRGNEMMAQKVRLAAENVGMKGTGSVRTRSSCRLFCKPNDAILRRSVLKNLLLSRLVRSDWGWSDCKKKSDGPLRIATLLRLLRHVLARAVVHRRAPQLRACRR